MADYRKHRLEKRTYSFDFVNQLATDDSLDSSPTVKIMEDVSGTWTDRSSEYGSLSPAISGTTVTWTLNAASSGVQDGGEYRVLVEVDTADGEHLVGEVSTRTGFRRPTLQVYEDADEDAP